MFKDHFSYFYNEAKIRWSTAAGPFWRKIMWLGGILSGTGATWSVLPVAFLNKIATYMIVAGAVMLFVAKFGAQVPPTPTQIAG